MIAGDFDAIAQNLAEVIDAILVTARDRERRVALIKCQVRRALALGYKAARGRANRNAAEAS